MIEIHLIRGAHRPGTARTAGRGLCFAAAFLGAFGAPAKDVAGQEGCEFGSRGNDVVNVQTLPGIGRVTYITRPHFLCQGGVQIFADSAVAYGDRGMSHLIGSVRYVESERELLADEARYFTNEGRLQAEGNVSVQDEVQGSSIHNGDLVYLLETAFREQGEMTVTTGEDGLRPTALLSPPRDSLEIDAPPDEPYTVVGDRIFLLGSGYFTATGTVEIERDSLLAFADSAEYDQIGGGLLLEGDARVVSSTYNLSGRTITVGAPGSGESVIHALREARLEGDDLLLTSAQIFLFMIDDDVERLVALPIFGPNALNADSLDLVRPEALVQDFVLTADSLEVNAPNQVVERVFAAGSARSVSSSADSLNVELLPEIARSDWLEGDTVIVNFVLPDSIPDELGGVSAEELANPSEDSGGALAVEDIVARGSARSLYRLPPSDSTARPGIDPPAVHYVVGDEIRIQMVGQAVHSMQVVGQTRGVHLEPLQRRPIPDTTAVPADTALVPDTLGGGTLGTARDTSGVVSPRLKAGGPSPKNRTESEHEPRRRMESVPWNRP